MFDVLTLIIAITGSCIILYDLGWLFYRNVILYVYHQKEFGSDSHMRVFSILERKYGPLPFVHVMTGTIITLLYIVSAFIPFNSHNKPGLWIFQLFYIIAIGGTYIIASLLQHARAVVELKKIKESQ